LKKVDIVFYLHIENKLHILERLLYPCIFFRERKRERGGEVQKK